MDNDKKHPVNRHTITSVNDIPPEFGPLRSVRKVTTVTTREPKTPAEEFKKSWGTITGVPGEDLVLISDADPDGYPCKIDIFEETYEETTTGSGEFRKKEINRIVAVPPGVEVLLKTLEGEEVVRHPDWIAVGKYGEVYANKAEWVGKYLEFLD